MHELGQKILIHKSIFFSVLSVFVLVCNLLFAYYYLHHLKGSQTVETKVSSGIQDDITSITVEIAGAVKVPGVYNLALGARVDDLLKKADGLDKNADLDYVSSNINLARILADQDKVFIPALGKSQKQIYNNSFSSSNNSVRSINKSTKVSLNQASVDELVALPAIGEVSAKKIIANRPYVSFDELVFKKILSKSQFQKISSMIEL